MQELTETDKAYIAGIIDGEGYLSIRRNKNKPSARGVVYYNWLTITNTNKELIDWLYSKFEFGTLSKKKPLKPNHKGGWDIRLCSLQVKSIIELIKPYLIVKKKQANIILEFSLYKANQGKRLTDEQFAKQEELYNEMTKLNKKGVEYVCS